MIHPPNSTQTQSQNLFDKTFGDTTQYFQNLTTGRSSSFFQLKDPEGLIDSHWMNRSMTDPERAITRLFMQFVLHQGHLFENNLGVDWLH